MKFKPRIINKFLRPELQHSYELYSYKKRKLSQNSFSQKSKGCKNIKAQNR